MLAPVIVTAPQFTFDTIPVSIEDAKLHMRLLHDAEDATIWALIKAGVAHLDGYNGVLGMALLEQQLKVMDYTWPHGIGALPIGPVQTINSVKYFDTNNVEQTLSASAYALLETAIGPVIHFKADATLPALYDRPDAISITFTAGYATKDEWPLPIIQHILEHVATMFENREKVIVGESLRVMSMPGADHLIAPYRVRRF